MPRAGRWLEEAGGSRGDLSNNVQDLSTMGHVVVVGSPYHIGRYVHFTRQPLKVVAVCIAYWNAPEIVDNSSLVHRYLDPEPKPDPI